MGQDKTATQRASMQLTAGQAMGAAAATQHGPGPAWEALAAARMTSFADAFAGCRQLFCALGDANRQLIFIELLRHAGGMRVGEVTACVNLSRPAVSHHLKVLRQAGLVDMYEVGTRNFYHVRPNVELWAALSQVAGGAEAFVRELVERERSEGTGCRRRNV